jgi:hypothetical protein
MAIAFAPLAWICRQHNRIREAYFGPCSVGYWSRETVGAIRTSAAIAMSLALLTLAACAAPVGLPNDATYDFGWKGLNTWTWRRTLPHGCVIWNVAGADGWAVLSADVSLCSVRDRDSITQAVARYNTITDELEFNYWPRTLPSPSLVMFDSHGRRIGDICPYTLTHEQLREVRVVVQEALTEARTDIERRSLGRIGDILSTTDGARLEVVERGCASRPTGGR